MSLIPTVKMADAAFPMNTTPSGFKVIAGYIGGDTPHVWNSWEWARFKGVKKLPIWTRDNAQQANAFDDAFKALEMLYLLGVPKGSPVVIDMETNPHIPYIVMFRSVLRWDGYKTWVYCSASSIKGSMMCDGVWVAKWDKSQVISDNRGIVAKQYTNGRIYDESVVKLSAYALQLKQW